MKLDAALSKLEERARGALRCEWCRYLLRDHPSLLRQTLADVIRPGDSPEKYLEYSCPWCGSSIAFAVGNLDTRQAECLRLYWGKANGERFRDPRVYAAEQWFYLHRTALKFLERARPDAPPPKPKPYRNQLPGRRADVPKDQRRAEVEEAERKAVEERGRRFFRRMRVEEKRRYGPHTFPLYAEVKAVLGVKAERLFSFSGPEAYSSQVAFEALRHLRACALCEPVLWGKVLPETAEAIAEAEGLARPYFEEVERRRVEREAREERERLEREAREQRTRVARPTPAISVARVAPEPPAGRPDLKPVSIPNPWELGKNEVKPKLPPDDGTDPYYAMKKVIYEHTGVWPPSG